MLARRAVFVWTCLAAICALPVSLAAFSPYLAWREPIYIVSGFAGILALVILFMQPLLAGGKLPGLSLRRARLVHRWIGAALVLAVLVHVIGLWLTSPPDVIDALLFRSPTPFSDWGVIAMWALFGAAALAAFRNKLRLSPRLWRILHIAMVVTASIGTVIHAILIEGTMEPVSKAALCALALAALAKTLYDLRALALIGAVLRRG